jgi:hypothetical protein
MRELAPTVEALQREVLRLGLRLQISEAAHDLFRWAVILKHTRPVWGVERASFLAIAGHYDTCVFRVAILRTRHEILRLLRGSEVFRKVRWLLDFFFREPVARNRIGGLF